MHNIKQKLHKVSQNLEMLKLSVELPAVCGNIVWGQRVSWFPHVCCKTPTQLVQLLSGVWHCSELWHLHHANWRVCISMWTSLLVCRTRLCFQLHTHIRWCVLQWVSDPVCCALACGYLEVSADVVSACGSGFTIFCLMETCINLADSFTVGGRSFCLLSTFSVCSPVTLTALGNVWTWATL